MLVNILVLAWRRPHDLIRVLEIIDSYPGDKIVYISVDGKTGSDIFLDEKIESTRKVVLEYRLCNPTSHILINPHNLGCGNAVSNALDWFFSQVDEGIIIEDDLSFNHSLLEYLDFCLKRYRDHKYIFSVNGHNPVNEHFLNIKKPYLSRSVHIWGWATWADRWKLYEKNFSPALRSMDNLSSLETIGSMPFIIKPLEYYFLAQFKEVLNGNIDTWDYQWVWTMWKYGGVALAPPVNLVENIGFSSEATHTKAGSSNKIGARSAEIVAEFLSGNSELSDWKIVQCAEECTLFSEINFLMPNLEQSFSSGTWLSRSKKLYRRFVPNPIRFALSPIVTSLRSYRKSLITSSRES